VSRGKATCALVFAAVALMALLPAQAWAHPLLDRAQRLFEEAEFQGALDVYAQAEQATDLSRDDLVTLYRQRALVHHAMGNTSELELDVFRLATLEPNLTLDASVPPVVRRAFDEAKGRVGDPVHVEATSARMPDGVRVTARVQNDLAAIVQAVRVTTRVDGGEWRAVAASTASVAAAEGANVEYFAEAIGPGGAVVAWAGTRMQPLRFGAAAAEGAAGAGGGGGGGGGGPVDTGEGGGVSAWPFIIGGVLVAGAIVLVVLLTGGPSDDTTVSYEGWALAP